MKRLSIILSLALILCFVAGCQDKEAMAELEQYKAQAALEEQNKELIRNMARELDTQGISSLNRYVSPECVVHYPGGREVQGLEAIVEWWQEADYLSLFMQLGMELKLKQGEK